MPLSAAGPALARGSSIVSSWASSAASLALTIVDRPRASQARGPRLESVLDFAEPEDSGQAIVNSVGPSRRRRSSSLYDRNGLNASTLDVQPSAVRSDLVFVGSHRRSPCCRRAGVFGMRAVTVAVPSLASIANVASAAPLVVVKLRQPSCQIFERFAQREFVPVRRISTASAKLDLPEPLRPTTSVRPGPRFERERPFRPMPRKPSTVRDSRNAPGASAGCWAAASRAAFVARRPPRVVVVAPPAPGRSPSAPSHLPDDEQRPVVLEGARRLEPSIDDAEELRCHQDSCGGALRTM